MSPASAKLEQLVHIIPLGYEIDRVVAPFHELKAHRVYLISMDDLSKYDKPAEHKLTSRQHEYDQRNCELLEAKGIDVILFRIDMFDIIKVMETVSRIIVKEKKDGNRVYVNMSACGKIPCVGATLAAMIHNVRLYYVRANRYSANEEEQEEHGLSICEEVRIWQLENFRFALPDETSLLLLNHLVKDEQELSCDDLIRFLYENEVDGFEEKYWELGFEKRRKIQTNYLMKLQNRYLNKLEDAGYIKRRKVGRNTLVKLTETGKYVAAVSGIDEV
ncbi:MAG: transcriptional regulator [Methanomicrobiales archaeon]|nr:transcriptional regulator [Methanomicrobiales archaeon]